MVETQTSSVSSLPMYSAETKMRRFAVLILRCGAQECHLMLSYQQLIVELARLVQKRKLATVCCEPRQTLVVA